MKKLTAITVFLIAVTMQAAAIGHYRPTRAAGISILPDLGIGVNHTEYIFTHWGAYAAYSHSAKKFMTDQRFETSQKFTAGIVWSIYWNTTIYPGYLTAGAAYNTYKGITPFYASKPAVTRPWSYEIGAGAILNRLATGIRVDVIKWDVSVDIKINFGRKEINPTKRHKK